MRASICLRKRLRHGPSGPSSRGRWPTFERSRPDLVQDPMRVPARHDLQTARGRSRPRVVRSRCRSAPGRTTPSLNGHLRHALEAPGVAPGSSAAMAIDLSTGETIFARNADTPLQPPRTRSSASLTRRSASSGPRYRFRTEVLGEGRPGRPCLAGPARAEGLRRPDPLAGDLGRLADRIAALGITRVTGHVVGDDSWFDHRFTVAGWLPGSRSPSRRRCRRSSSTAAGARDVRWRAPHSPPPRSSTKQLRASVASTRATRRSVARARTRSRLAKAESRQLARHPHRDRHRQRQLLGRARVKAIGREVLGRGLVGRRRHGRPPRPCCGRRPACRRADRRRLGSLAGQPRHRARACGAPARDLARPRAAPARSRLAGRRGDQRHARAPPAGPPARGRVRAKTGTTSIASALSGYVGARYAFVVVHNGAP